LFTRSSPLVIVDDLNLIDIPVPPFEAGPVLIVDANAVLPLSIAGQLFETHTGDGQILKTHGGIQLSEALLGAVLNRPKLPARDAVENLLGFLVAARPDHTYSILHYAYAAGAR